MLYLDVRYGLTLLPNVRLRYGTWLGTTTNRHITKLDTD